jgi:hypothetical protein
MAYSKFTRQRGSIVSVDQFWAGEDHLLLVSSSFAVERYRRFYYQDIEAFIIRPTTARRTWSIICAFGVVIFAGIALAAGRQAAPVDRTMVTVLCAIPALMFLIALIFHLAMGPTCRTFLQMRTGLERIPTANRLRAALRMRDRLAALIGAAAEARSIASALP